MKSIYVTKSMVLTKKGSQKAYPNWTFSVNYAKAILIKDFRPVPSCKRVVRYPYKK